MGINCFDGCTSLTNAKVSANADIPTRAFSSCTNLSSITIPEGVTTIGYEAFAYTYKLLSLEIPLSITNIGNGAFSYCENIKELIVPSSVWSIGSNAFSGCKSLKNIDIAGGYMSDERSVLRAKVLPRINRPTKNRPHVSTNITPSTVTHSKGNSLSTIMESPETPPLTIFIGNMNIAVPKASTSVPSITSAVFLTSKKASFFESLIDHSPFF
jgi:hypothetical protein